MIHANIASSDIEVISHQFGGREIFVNAVVSRCFHGMPSVVLLAPINFTAVATPLWLSCPFFNRKIHVLESKGFIKKIETMIYEDNFLAEQMRKAHKHYAGFRMHTCNDFFAARADSFDAKKLIESGAGGIKDTKNLKCLHLAAAHYAVCGDNEAGKAVFELLGDETHCADGACCSVTPV